MRESNQLKECQKLWAAHKYLVLSNSGSIYNEIREYLKRENAQVRHVLTLIDQACTLPEDRGQVCNAFQHIWGYFKKKATASEKEMFMAQLESYATGRIPQMCLVASVKELLIKYPNRYLEESTLINGGSK